MIGDMAFSRKTNTVIPALVAGIQPSASARSTMDSGDQRRNDG
jgi:hypothetical protein